MSWGGFGAGNQVGEMAGSRNLCRSILHQVRPSMKRLNQDKPILDDVRGEYYVVCSVYAQ